MVIETYKKYSVSNITRLINRYLFFLLVCILLAGAWYFFVYLNLERQIQHYDIQAAQMRRHKQIFPVVSNQIAKMAQQKALLEKQYALFCTQSQRVDSLGSVMQFIKLVSEAGLQLESSEIGQNCLHDWHTKQLITFLLKGEMGNIATLIANIIASSLFCYCSKLELKTIGNGRFTIRGTIDLFSFKEPACHVQKKPFNLTQAEGLGG